MAPRKQTTLVHNGTLGAREGLINQQLFWFDIFDLGEQNLWSRYKILRLLRDSVLELPPESNRSLSIQKNDCFLPFWRIIYLSVCCDCFFGERSDWNVLSLSLVQVHGSVGEPWWLWVEDPINDHIYHSEYFLLQKKQVFHHLLSFLIRGRFWHEGLFLKELMDVCPCLSSSGGNRRASARRVHHPHLWAAAVSVLHQGGVRPLAGSWGRLHHQLPEPHPAWETPSTHRYTHSDKQ